MDAATLFAAFLWSLIGAGFCIYGWRRKAKFCLGAGLVLVVMPYIVESALYMSLIGAAILASVFVFEKKM